MPARSRDAPLLEDLRRQAARCRRCGLWRNATQVVVGEGMTRARVMLVGEQPGDVEDQQGRPFVGPAGVLLRRVVREVGFDERDIYLTNAVKHFKWRAKGKRRIHDTPTWSEVHACDVWLRLELGRVVPDVVVCLGATAAQALLGRDARVNALRGRLLEALDIAPTVVVTFHPSAVLRAGERRAQLHEQLVDDLLLARSALRMRGRGVSTASASGSPERRTFETERKVDMPPRGVKRGSKRARQYKHVKESLKERGRPEELAEEIAARTVNKERARHGEARESSSLSRDDISSGRRGGIRSHRKAPRGRTRDQLYEEARQKGIEGRSKMTKAELARAVGPRR